MRTHHDTGAERDAVAAALARTPRAHAGLRIRALVDWRRVAVVGLGSLCAACGGSLFESKIPQPDRFVLAAAPAASAPTQSAAAQADIAIGRPDVVPGLDTNRIAVLRGRQLEYFRAAQWGGSVAEVVQALLVGSFQDQHLFRSVTTEQARVSSDYVLDSEVRDFQAEYGSGSTPQVKVTIVGRIIRIEDRQLVDTLHSSATLRADENRLIEVTGAFESAAQQVALELAQQMAAAVAKDLEQTQARSTSVKDR